MERVSQPFMAPCCRGYGRGDLVLTRLALSDLPHDEFLVESRIGRHLFHATARKRSERDALPGTVGTAGAVLAIAVTCHSPCTAKIRNTVVG